MRTMTIKLSFSTLACPQWDWNQIIDEASQLGYQGLEIRGIEKELYLPKVTPFLPKNLGKTIKQLKEKGLEICCLDTSCQFSDQGTFDQSIKEGKETIDLADEIGVPYIRVFGGEFSKSSDEKKTMEMIRHGLETLSDYAQNKKVEILIETHDVFASTKQIKKLLEKVNRNNVNVLWDISNTYKVAEEMPEDSYNRIGKYVKHVHVKDTIGKGREPRPCIIGKGDVPITEFVTLLATNNYQGWLSFEWEKRWYPDLEEPQVALRAYIDYMIPLLNRF
ncbi:MAG: sugar phosphate isomerase/epimerase family protein [Caldisphaera sp.]